MDSIKVLFTIASLHPEHGGPSQSVPGLCEGLGRAGVGVEIVSLHYGKTWKPPLAPATELVTTTYVDCSFAPARRAQWTPRFNSVLRERCRASSAQIIHDTGVWLLTNHAAASAARGLGLPFIISPRGMLTAWSLRHKGWKKRMAWRLYQQRDLQSAQVLHATSREEIKDFRAAGLTQPIAVIPNGVELPIQKSEVRGQKSGLRSPTSDLRTILFLGRIHPVKGLTNLVKAWASIQRSEAGGHWSASSPGGLRPGGVVSGQPKWRIIIAGRDEEGHKSDIEAEIRKLKVENDFEFIGPVEGEAKWDLYRSADLFVLPSHSENFGLVVAEALACGVPVITTKGAPWEELVTQHCGWWIDKGVEPLTAALREAMALSDEQRKTMGQQGRRLVEQNYSWPKIAVEMKSVYEWVLGGGARPGCVV